MKLWVVLGLMAGAAPLILIGVTAWIARLVETAAPPVGRFVDLAGQRLHYLDKGQGPVVVLIHGLSGQLLNFDYGLVERLTDEFRVIAIDRPGSGHSAPFHEGDSSLVRQALLIAALMDRLELGPALIVGHSLGGAIALALTLEKPDLVRGVVLVAPLTQVQHHVPDAFRLLAVRAPVLRQIISWVIATPAAIMRRDGVLASLFGPESAPKDFGLRGGGLLSLRPSAYIAATEDLAAAERDMASLVPRYGQITQPVSLIYGEGDQILDPQLHAHALQARLPSVDLHAINGGHMLPVTASRAVASLIRALHDRVA